MMFPAKPPSPPMPQTHAGLVSDDSSAMQQIASSRADYDLHPLIVRGLEHYLDQGESEDRFHIR